MDVTMINYTPINLQNYIGKEVTAFLRNGKKLVDRIIYDNRVPNYPYKFGLRCYTKDGRTLIDNNCPSDIMFLWVEEKEDKELEEKLRKVTEKVMMNNQEILISLNEKIKAAEESLLYLNQTKEGIVRMIANSKKSPVEEAYKDWCGEYPSGTSSNASQWVTFQAGYSAAYEEKVNEEPQNSKPLWERFYDAKWSDSACDEFCEIVKEWISQYGCDYNDTYAEGYEDALATLKENLK